MTLHLARSKGDRTTTTTPGVAGKLKTASSASCRTTWLARAPPRSVHILPASLFVVYCSLMLRGRLNSASACTVCPEHRGCRAAPGQTLGLAGCRCGVSTNMYGRARTTPPAADAGKPPNHHGHRPGRPAAACPQRGITCDASNLSRARRIRRTVGTEGVDRPTAVRIASTVHPFPLGRPPPRLVGAPPPRSGLPSLPSISS